MPRTRIVKGLRLLALCLALSSCRDTQGTACTRSDDCSSGQVCNTDLGACEPAPLCGDGFATGDEACDGAELRGETCSSRGFDGGELGCAADCSGFDESGCGRCGDGACTAGEDVASCAADCFVPDLAFNGDEPDVSVLFVADAKGTTVNLSGALAAGGSVSTFAWSPDRQWIAFTAGKADSGVTELFVVPARGGTATKVSGPMVAGGSIDRSNFAWAPDSSRIAYQADQDTDGVRELYTSLPTGGNVKVSGPMVAGGSIDLLTRFAWAPDSSRVAYVADQDTDGVNELYTSLAAGGGNVKVSLAANGSVDRFAWAPDSSRIAYLNTRADGVFTSLPAGGGHVTVSGAVDRVDSFRWAPDSSRIAYVARQDTAFRELYTSLPAGGGNVKVSGTLVANGSVDQFAWAPDSSRIAYRASQDAADVRELYTSLPAGGGNIKVSGTLVANGWVESFVWAPDSSRIAYRADQDTDEVNELYTSLPASGGNVKISAPLVAGVQLSTYRWAPSSSHIAYVAGVPSESGLADLQTTVPIGGDTRLISSNVESFAWAPDGSRIAFRVTQDEGELYQLRTSPPGGGASTLISGSKDVDGYAWPDP